MASKLTRKFPSESSTIDWAVYMVVVVEEDVVVVDDTVVLVLLLDVDAEDTPMVVVVVVVVVVEGFSGMEILFNPGERVTV